MFEIYSFCSFHPPPIVIVGYTVALQIYIYCHTCWEKWDSCLNFMSTVFHSNEHSSPCSNKYSWELKSLSCPFFSYSFFNKHLFFLIRLERKVFLVQISHSASCAKKSCDFIVILLDSCDVDLSPVPIAYTHVERSSTDKTMKNWLVEEAEAVWLNCRNKRAIWITLWSDFNELSMSMNIDRQKRGK